MSRLFYHVMQDNSGNLLFDVSGTMRLAGTGTLATIYGDEALTIPIANPMTNHPSYGSFKCFLGPGDYDFYMAKSGYTFETLTGVQGHGTMAQQDASAVAITGGNVTGLATLTVTGTAGAANASLTGVIVPNFTPSSGTPTAFSGQVTAGTNRYNVYMDGTAANYMRGALGVGAQPGANTKVTLLFDKSVDHGLRIQQSVSDVGSGGPILFYNVAGVLIGSITSTAAAVAYNTTSDARLKHAVQTLGGELTLIRALRPVSFIWNADGEPGVGFLAHEVAEHVPGVVTGEPDAVDDEGGIVPQQIDMSKLVPWLVGACKSLIERVEALQARVEVLEDAAGV